MKKIKGNYRWPVIIALAINLTACAYGDRKIALAPESISVSEGGNKSAVSFHIQIQDIRSDKSSLGAVRNGFMEHTADIKSADDAGKWVRESLINSLQEAGYKFTTGKEKLQNQEFSILLKVFRIFSDVQGGVVPKIEGKIDAIAIVDRSGTKENEKTISGYTLNEADLFDIAGSYRKGLKSALSDFIKKVADMIDKLHSS